MFRTTKPYYITMAVAALIMIVAIVISSFSGGSIEKEVAQQEEEIVRLNNEIAAKSAAISSGNANVVGSTTGIDLQRVSNDDDVARAFIQKMTNWTNYDEYTTARFELIQDYGLQANSNLLKVFMPEYPDVYDKAGNSYNFIDFYGLSCSYKGMKSMVRNISDDGTYSYFTIVTCTGVKNGAGGDFNLAVLYSVDAAGGLSDFNAYTLDSFVWVS